MATVEAWPLAAGSPALPLVRSRVKTGGRRRSIPSLSSRPGGMRPSLMLSPRGAHRNRDKQERLGKKIKGKESTEKERKEQRINCTKGKKEGKRENKKDNELRKKEKGSETEKGKK